MSFPSITAYSSRSACHSSHRFSRELTHRPRSNRTTRLGAKRASIRLRSFQRKREKVASSWLWIKRPQVVASIRCFSKAYSFSNWLTDRKKLIRNRLLCSPDIKLFKPIRIIYGLRIFLIQIFELYYPNFQVMLYKFSSSIQYEPR